LQLEPRLHVHPGPPGVQDHAVLLGAAQQAIPLVPALVAPHDDGGLAADRGDPIGAPGDPCSSNAGRWLMARDIGTI